MDYLPVSLQRWMEGRIDPQSQHLIETYSQTYLIALTAICFLLSYFASSVLLSIEVFTGGLTLLLLLAVPPWPFLRRYPIKFLPVRKAHMS